jgi:hypothetical protein
MERDRHVDRHCCAAMQPFMQPVDEPPHHCTVTEIDDGISTPTVGATISN